MQTRIQFPLPSEVRCESCGERITAGTVLSGRTLLEPSARIGSMQRAQVVVVRCTHCDNLLRFRGAMADPLAGNTSLENARPARRWELVGGGTTLDAR